MNQTQSMKARSITWREITYLYTEIIATELSFLQITNSKFHQLVHNSNYCRLCLLYYSFKKYIYLEKNAFNKKKITEQVNYLLLLKFNHTKKKNKKLSINRSGMLPDRDLEDETMATPSETTDLICESVHNWKPNLRSLLLASSSISETPRFRIQ